MALVLPALWLLFYLFKARRKPAPQSSAEAYAAALPTAEDKLAPLAGPSRGVQAPAAQPWVEAVATVGLGTLALLVILSSLWYARRRPPMARSAR